MSDIKWSKLFALVVISFMVSFITFLLTEIIWGDILKSTLSKSYKAHLYSNINLILIIGLGFILGVSIFINIIIFRDYTAESKVKSNLFAFILTFLILYCIASLSVIIIYSKQYAGLSIVQKMSVSWLFLSYYSIYLLPGPVWLWIMALIIYHIVLFFLMKLLLDRNIFKLNIHRSKRTSSIDKKYSLLGG